jgi:hypothetical protein
VVTFKYDFPKRGYKGQLDDDKWDYYEAWRIKPGERAPDTTEVVKNADALIKKLQARAQRDPVLANLIQDRIKILETYKKGHDIFGMVPFAQGTAGSVSFNGLAWYIDCLDEAALKKHGFKVGEEVNGTHAGFLPALSSKTKVTINGKRLAAFDAVADLMKNQENVSEAIPHTITVLWKKDGTTTIKDQDP